MRTFYFILLLLLSVNGIAQKKYLILEDKINKTQFAVREGHWLKVTYHNDEVFRGAIRFVNDSIISVGLVKLRLKDIKSIQTFSFGANMFRALVITTGIISYLVSATVVVLLFAVLIVSIANGNPIYFDYPNRTFEVEPISTGINSLLEVADYMEKTFPAENFNYIISTATVINKD